MNKYITICVIAVTFLNSCVNPTPQRSAEIYSQPTLDPVVTQIIELADKIESGRLTEYQEKQLPDFKSFVGRKIAASGEVYNVTTNGIVEVRGDGISLLSSTPFITFRPKDPTSTISMSRGQPISVKGTITAVEHTITKYGWLLTIYISE